MQEVEAKCIKIVWCTASRGSSCLYHGLLPAIKWFYCTPSCQFRIDYSDSMVHAI